MTAGRIIAIDEDHLDQEWIEQPRLVLRYCELQAQARFDHTDAENKLELAEAQLFAKIRTQPEKFGLSEPKPSVDLVKSKLIATKTYQTALAAVNSAKRDLDMCSAAVAALENRKKALENIVDLREMDYYSEPRQPRQPIDRERIQTARKNSARKPIRKKDE